MQDCRIVQACVWCGDFSPTEFNPISDGGSAVFCIKGLILFAERLKSGKTRKEKGMKKERGKNLDEVVAYIRKRMGQEAIMRLGAEEKRAVPVIPSGSLALDIALGIGGFPRGRVVEMYGPEGSGKTTVALHIVANVHKLGGVAAFIDAEHALDVGYAKRLGVQVENLLLSQPDYAEQALEISEALVATGEVDLVVVDSVAALVPKSELEGSFGEQYVGLQARLMSQALRKLAGTIAKKRACVVFINQLREKVGVMFGSPEVTPGGRALKFYSSVRVDVRTLNKIKGANGRIVGAHVRARVTKNKLAPPFREAEFEIIYGKGINRAADVLDTAVTFGVVERSGAWYSYGGERLGQGRDAAAQTLRDNPELTNKIVRETLKAAGVEPVLKWSE